MNKAFFLDRDGTINVDYDYVHKKEEWTWCEGALEALKWIREHGYLIFIVTNQSGVARGHFTREQVDELHDWVDSQLEAVDLSIDEWYVAPWHPDFHEGKNDELLRERKPGTALFQRAREMHDIDYSISFMAGDKVTDIKPAIERGMKPFFIRSRHEKNQDMDWIHYRNIPVCESLLEVIKFIEQNHLNE